MAKPVDQRAQEAVKTIVQRLIKNISIIAIFIAIGIIGMSYLGLDFDMSVSLVARILVPSVILAISNLIIFELWLRNGADNARGEKAYIDLLTQYYDMSCFINEETMQEFLVAEKQRRYDVEKKRLENIIERETKLIEFLNTPKKKGDKDIPLSPIDKIRINLAKGRLHKAKKAIDNIQIDMPYERAEQFDQLRYTIRDTHYKEYKPNDTGKFLAKRRTKKYTMLLTFTLIGFNIISVTTGGENWLIALFMTILAAVSLLASLVFGFSDGYSSIAVSNTGVYKTGVSFIQKAQAYCTKHGKKLYFIPEAVNDGIPMVPKKTEEIKPEVEVEQISMDSLFGSSPESDKDQSNGNIMK